MEKETSNILTISKEELAELPIEKFAGKIVVVDNTRLARRAIEVLSQAPIIGFDTETRPSFRRGQSNRVALLQLSTSDTCFLFRLNRLGLLPEVKALLEDENRLKVGISLKDDFCMLNRLHEDSPLQPKNFVELQSLVKQYGIKEQSLQKIYGIVAGKRITKGQRLSNWEADELTEGQQLYAATDAWSCIEIYNILQSGKFEQRNIIQ